MSIDTLLDAIEQYMEAQRKADTDLTPHCSDWDCGLAIEFDPPSSLSGRQNLRGVKDHLEKVLNEYIDSRIKYLLGSQQGVKEQSATNT
jgi:hypothetical protein